MNNDQAHIQFERDREAEKTVLEDEPVCTYEQCGLGHECTSGCGNDFDCPCTSEHEMKE